MPGGRSADGTDRPVIVDDRPCSADIASPKVSDHSHLTEATFLLLDKVHLRIERDHDSVLVAEIRQGRVRQV